MTGGLLKILLNTYAVVLLFLPFTWLTKEEQDRVIEVINKSRGKLCVIKF